jgi:hypothetical protein
MACTVANLPSILTEVPANTADSPHTISIAAETDICGDDWAGIDNAVRSAGKYVILDLSGCGASSYTAVYDGPFIKGESNPVPGTDFNIIWDNEYIKGIILPDTLVHLGNGALLYCRFLTSVTIPAGMKVIGATVFFCCERLQSITIPAGVTYIRNYAFYYSGLTSVIFEGSAAVIESDETFPEGAGLKAAYEAGGAGAYTLSGGVWTKR